jgi:hypothetical protein
VGALIAVHMLVVGYIEAGLVQKRYQPVPDPAPQS